MYATSCAKPIHIVPLSDLHSLNQNLNYFALSDDNSPLPETPLQEHFLVNSQRYGQETALSLRVKEWEEKIRPELAMQVQCRESLLAAELYAPGETFLAAMLRVPLYVSHFKFCT